MIASDAVGFQLPEVVEEISVRRVLAFAAGIGDTSDAVFDDCGELCAPPSLCVSLEWPLMSHPALRERLGAGPEEMLRGVHVSQDSHFARPIEPGMRVRTSGHLAGLRNTSAGALCTLRVESRDDAGVLVTSWIQLLFRGLPVTGADREAEAPPEVPQLAGEASKSGEAVRIPIARELPHLYTECASIWNPIHTERRVALAAGLPDIILHGTATWALAGRELIARNAAGDPARLLRLHGRFRGMVIPGSEIALHSTVVGAGLVSFSVRNATDELAIEAGFAQFEPA